MRKRQPFWSLWTAMDWAGRPGQRHLVPSKPGTGLPDRALSEHLALRLRSGRRPAEGQDGQLGDGHTNIGAGRVVYQDLPRIPTPSPTAAFFGPRLYGRHGRGKGKRTALHLIGFYPMGAFTAITVIFTPCCGWQNSAVSKRCISTAAGRP